MLKKLFLSVSLPSCFLSPKGLSRTALLPIRFLTLFSLLLFIVFFTSPSLRALEIEKISTPSGVVIELTYSALRPGEVIAVSIKDHSALKRALVRILKKNYTLGLDPSNQGLLAFVGLGLDLEPGFYPMEVFIEKAGGWESAGKQIQVTAREFPLKRLWVPERYIKPPPEFRERIKLEGEILSIVYGIETEQWLGEGQFILPSSGKVRSNFGQRRIYNNEIESIHSGIDISEPYGTPVRASNSGRVVLANNLYFSGKTVIIDHGLGLFTSYCHFSRIKVKRGEIVKKGQVIGYAGATGRATGPHLHWGVKVCGKTVDPFSLLSLSLN